MTKFKLIKKVECWRLTWFARFLVLLFLIISFYVIIKNIVPFLSANSPVNGNILVLDGYFPDYAVIDAIKTFEQGNYKQVVTTGGDISIGFYLTEVKSMAELTRSVFINIGFDSTKVVAISTGTVTKNRTYSSAMALKNWLDKQNIENTSVDVFVIGCHAKRSKLLFSRALEKEIKVGVISVEDKTYDPEKWWSSSKGMRTVISEFLAYLYTLFVKN